jgi:predicted MFS family arabinose efflux permease
VSRAEIGLASSAFAIGAVATALGGRALLDGLTPGRLLRSALVGFVLGTLLLITVRELPATVGAAFILGASGTSVLIVVPVVIEARQGPARAAALAEANVGAALAGILAPLAIGAAILVDIGWQVGMALVLVPVAILIPLVGRQGDTPKEPPHGAAELDPAARPRLPGAYWRWWAAIVLGVGTEFCVVFWGADYLQEEVGVSRGAASVALGLFVAGMATGRFAGSRLAVARDARRLLVGGLVVAALGFSIFWTATGAAVAFPGLLVMGTGVATLYPLSLSLAMAAAPRLASAASARASLGSGLAVLVAPFALAALADGIGVKPAFLIVYGLIAGGLAVALGRPRTRGAPHTRRRPPGWR